MEMAQITCQNTLKLWWHAPFWIPNRYIFVYHTLVIVPHRIGWRDGQASQCKGLHSNWTEAGDYWHVSNNYYVIVDVIKNIYYLFLMTLYTVLVPLLTKLKASLIQIPLTCCSSRTVLLKVQHNIIIIVTVECNFYYTVLYMLRVMFITK